MDLPFKSLLSLASDGGNRVNPLLMLCNLGPTTVGLVAGLLVWGSCGSMRSHTDTDMLGNSRDTVFTRPRCLVNTGDQQLEMSLPQRSQVGGSTCHSSGGDFLTDGVNKKTEFIQTGLHACFVVMCI